MKHLLHSSLPWRATSSRRATLLLAACASLLFSAAPSTWAEEGATPPPVRTADAVQEAFVRVAQRVRSGVVSIEAQRNPSSRGESGSEDDDKPQDKAPSKPEPKGSRPAPKPEAKPAPKVPGQPESKPAPKGGPPSEEDEEEEEEGFGMPFPFGPRDPNARPRSMGTGMVISADGLILTNYHVVRGAAFVRVLFDPDAETPDNPAAQVVGYDEESDLAVLRLMRPKPDLKPVEFANSDEVRIGEWAMAVGAPFEQAQSVTVGIISAKSRHLEGKDGSASLQDYIQTDASINPGNSGGPLFNLEGKVIGVNTAILSPSRFNVGIGFAVPANTVKTLLPTLLRGEAIQRGFIGINYMPLNPGVAQEFGIEGGMHIGALPLDEETGKPVGPAKEAGLQVDDIITHLNGKAIFSSEEFRRVVSGQPPGTPLTLSIVRPAETGVEKKDVILKLGARPGKKLSIPRLKVNPRATSLGVEVEDADKLSSEQRELYKFDERLKGAIVLDVVPGSSADEADVRRGLRLVRARVNGGAWQPIANTSAWLRLEKLLPAGARVLLQLRDRDNISVYNLLVAPGARTGNVS
jgi:serine protease Do